MKNPAPNRCPVGLALVLAWLMLFTIGSTTGCRCGADSSDLSEMPATESDLPAFLADPPAAYATYKKSLRARCLRFEDFHQDRPLARISHAASGEYRGAFAWWFPKHNRPKLIGEYLALRATRDGNKREAQTIEGFTGGTLVIGAWSDRWPEAAGWTDTSIGWELWKKDEHEGIVLADGKFGVFSDVDGQCKGTSVCRWKALVGIWPYVQTMPSPQIFSFRWRVEQKVAELGWVDADGEEQPVTTDATAFHLNGPLKVRLNASLEDARDPVAAETLYVDFVCIMP